MQCGGSDSYSGITANPALGIASDMIIDHKMSEARHLQAIARSPRLTIGMTLPLIEDLLGAPHEKIISEEEAKKEQLWIYYLNEKQLQLSFKDFILFKIEEL